MPVNLSISRSVCFRTAAVAAYGSTPRPVRRLRPPFSDSTIGLDAGNGLNALGSSSNVMVDLLRDVIAFNGTAGVQANGATAAVLVNGTALLNNSSALSAVGGGRILTYGNNSIVGPAGSAFRTGTASLQ